MLVKNIHEYKISWMPPWIALLVVKCETTTCMEVIVLLSFVKFRFRAGDDDGMGWDGKMLSLLGAILYNWLQFKMMSLIDIEAWKLHVHAGTYLMMGFFFLVNTKNS